MEIHLVFGFEAKIGISILLILVIGVLFVNFCTSKQTILDYDLIKIWIKIPKQYAVTGLNISVISTYQQLARSKFTSAGRLLFLSSTVQHLYLAPHSNVHFSGSSSDFPTKMKFIFEINYKFFEKYKVFLLARRIQT